MATKPILIVDGRSQIIIASAIAQNRILVDIEATDISVMELSSIEDFHMPIMEKKRIPDWKDPYPGKK